MSTNDLRPFSSSGPLGRPLRPVSALIIEMLADGMSCRDDRVAHLSRQAMRAFFQGWFDPPDDERRGCVFEEREPPPQATALTGLRTSWAEARPAVVRALLASLYLEDRQLNMRALRVAAAFPDRIIDTLVAHAVWPDISVNHCRRLLEAIDLNGAMLCNVGAEVLSQLERKPWFEEVRPQVRMLLGQRWETVDPRKAMFDVIARHLAQKIQLNLPRGGRVTRSP